MLKVLNTGLWSSIQDQGRFGFRHLGIPVSGVMDKRSANLANLLLNNPPQTAVMEITLNGPELQFLKQTTIAIVGADMSPKLNGELQHLNTAFDVDVNDILSFGHLSYGARCYLAVKNGFKTTKDLDSRSFYSSITQHSRLSVDELIKYHEFKSELNVSHASVKIDENHFSNITLKVSKGPEFKFLSIDEHGKLLNQNFTISKNNDRMAYQLEELLDNNLSQILTSAVLPGTVQLTPGGKLIVLMRDCQTTGGYPRVLQLSEEAINCLSQKKLGDTVRFSLQE